MQNIESRNNNQKSFDFRDFVVDGKSLPFKDRITYFSEFIEYTRHNQQNCYMRETISSADREVTIADRETGKNRKMLMFGSNNYLGLSTHPYVCQKVKKTIDQFGVGIGGPSLLNGYTRLMRELEERLSTFKHQEDTLIFSSGFSTNLGLIGGLLGSNDVVIFDEYSHASFYDGLRLANIPNFKFPHNNINEINFLFNDPESIAGRTKFVGVEGVYSMDGDLSPLDEIVPLCKKNNALLILDDAHGTGVMGEKGSGTSEHYGFTDDIDIVMGTFSKTFSVTGGFISSSKPIIEYLRYFARPYMFSASLPPVTIAAVLAGLDVIQNEPELRIKLHQNVEYVRDKLTKYNMIGKPVAGIISLLAPPGMNIRKAAYEFHQSGIFLNAIEYPAVPENMQRFRISIMATHTKEDLNRLVENVEKIWIQNY